MVPPNHQPQRGCGQVCSQETLLKKADLHPTHVSLIERFQRNPPLNVAASLAPALGLKPSEMFAEAEGVR
jgi:transcriptional regulator with XRE-family HTH domain